MRILALGVLNNPRGAFTVNRNARALLHPPGIEMTPEKGADEGSSSPGEGRSRNHHQYERLTHPLPALSHAAYPFYTSGGGDKRWLSAGTVEEEGKQWVGGLMSVYLPHFDAI
jgi:hypothetical protein